MINEATPHESPQPITLLETSSTADYKLTPPGARNSTITEEEILAMADAHFAEHGV